MAINNFKELERQNEKEYGTPPEHVRDNILGSLSLFKFIGDILELYLPRVFSLMVRMSGGAPIQNVSNELEEDKGEHRGDNTRPKYPNTDS